MALLEIDDLHAGYGAIKALHGVSLSVEEGEIFALVGANGAGKTTLLMTICGVVPAESGKIRFRGEDITNQPTYHTMRHSISQVPEGRRIFPRMSVLENLQMGMLATKENATTYQKRLDWIFDLFPILAQRQKQDGGTLSGGEQQMLAIGRALMSQPKLLLLDEPSLGLAPLLVKRIFETLGEIRKQGTTILLVEQNAFAALKLAQNGCVLSTGETFLRGRCADLLQNTDVQRAYLGG